MKFQNLGLKTKILATSTIPIVLAVTLSIVSVISLRELLSLVDRSNQSYKVINLAMKTQDSAHDMRSALEGFLLSRKDSALEPYKDARKKLIKFFEALKSESISPAQLKTISEAQEHLDKWEQEAVEPSIRLRRSVKGNEDWEKFDQAMNAFENNEFSALTESKSLGHIGESSTERIMIFGTMFLVIITLPLSFFLARSMTKPLGEAVNLAEAIAGGNLSQSLDVKTKDEVGTLGYALNHMVNSLREQTAKMSDGANVLASSAAEISASVAQLASSATETSSAVTETVSTVEELQQTAKLSSEKAKKVAEGAHQAVKIADDGEKAIEATVQKMNSIKTEMESIGETVQRLSEQSQSIEEIVNSVHDLADQSNLLAVNASIEAAKAGELGKGFTVVAGEIKLLADRSRESTEQIRSILEDTKKWITAVVMATEQGNKAVLSGVRQSRLAGESITSLCKSVMESAESATIIQASSEQQAIGVDQVSNAMVYIDQAIKQNVAGATQLEEAARQISDLGETLKQLVERYKM
ncbi:MAG: methyl-accepting chemotaxis protein [Desulfomonilaceae bacterium]